MGEGRDEEPFLAAGRVDYAGQPVLVILAGEAHRHEVLVDEEPGVFAPGGDFLCEPLNVQRGDAAVAIGKAPHRLAGRLNTGGQVHQYLEPQSVIAYPEDAGRIRLLASTQNPSQVQRVVARMLGCPMRDVTVECERMGGAFGGKETRAALPAMAAALTAAKLQRPARCVLTRAEDMAITGRRHAFTASWEAGFSSDGEIEALIVDLWSDGGAYPDLSEAVMTRALLHLESAYFIPHLTAAGRAGRTNYPPATAFRGFGVPQATALMEAVIEEIAAHLGIETDAVRLRNLFRAPGRDQTVYGQCVDAATLHRIFHVAPKWNPAANDARSLRGYARIPVKFGISFSQTHLNQASATVQMLRDGSVQVSTGATEMGQGARVKLRRLAARALQIEEQQIRVLGASTDRQANTAPTAASASILLNGEAVLAACARIRERLQKLGEGTSAELAERAFRARVDLGERAFYATPDVGYDPRTGHGRPYLYFTMGAAAVEVAIDRLTGEVRVPRAELVIDAGGSLAEDVDRGQVMGGFLQGLGWILLEELQLENGHLRNDSFANYKIPCASDVPAVFNVQFWRDSLSPPTGRGVGEPPFVMAVAIWAAIRRALHEAGSGPLELDLPATPERIREILRRCR
jgi:xanthine dehydrogenase large subunit